MVRVGGLTKKYYKETRGIKVAGGQTVKGGTILTRQGDKWKPGLNVTGRIHLAAACAGKVYFTKKRGLHSNVQTYVNIEPVSEA